MAAAVRHRSESRPVAWALATARWRYRGGKRDARLDLLRGFSAFAMVADHIGGHRSYLYPLTGGNRFYTGAAEAFVFISGAVMGMVYLSVVQRQGEAAVFGKSLRRAATLYLLTVFLTLTTPVLAWWWDLPWALQIAPADLPRWVAGVLTLHETYFLADILLLYTFLIAAAGPVVWLLARGKALPVVAASWTLWLLWQIWPSVAEVPWTVGNNTVFHVAAWQVLFVNALVLGYHRTELELWVRKLHPAVLVAAAAALVLAAAALFFGWLGPLTDDSPTAERFFSKENVGAGRLVVFAAAFTLAYGLVSLLWLPVRRATGWLLMPLGTHALGAYAFHLYIVAAAWAFAPHVLGEHGIVETTLLQLAGVGVAWLGVLLLGWIERAWDARTAARAGKERAA